MSRPTGKTLLRFRENDLGDDKEVRDSLSAVVQTGITLWVAADETVRIERLSRQTDGNYGGHVVFPLDGLLALPAPLDEEADIEGMSAGDGYLWLVGSHSWKRKQPKKGATAAASIARLAETTQDGNRFLLARLPLVEEGDGARLVREHAGRQAARLRGDARGDELTWTLADDPHLAPFLNLPGKDNGLDIEGLAVTGERLFLGLRGPVLRGWAILLELRVGADDVGDLRLIPFAETGRRYRKHFLNLGGCGVRDLVVDGSDLLILAGPTMELDGPTAVFRWPGGADPAAERFVSPSELEPVAAVPHGKGQDHAEGMTLVKNAAGARSLLVVYDSPAKERKPEDEAVWADRFDLP